MMLLTTQKGTANAARAEKDTVVRDILKEKKSKRKHMKKRYAF